MLKYLPPVSFWCVLALFCVMVAQAVSVATEQPNKPTELPDLVAKSITIKGEKGTGSVTISATKEGPGIWLTAPNGDLVCITALGQNGGRTVCIMKKYEDGFKAANIAIAMDGDGTPLVQFRASKGDIQFLPLEKLTEMGANRLPEGEK